MLGNALRSHIDISVAILTTKVSILIKSGFWSMIHKVRMDYSMLLSLIFLLIAGVGLCSIGAKLIGKIKG
ncbi:MAG TPA: hypothetical protein ACFYD6_09415 [Candidatus Brocadiia bacterium]